MAQTSEQSTGRTLPQVPANTISFGQKSGNSDHRNGTTEQLHGMISYDRIPISCCTIDSNAFIRDVNESMCALFGFPMDALTQKSFVELVVSSSFESVETILSGESGDSGGKSDRLLHPGGSELSLWFRKRDGTVFPGTMRIQSAEEHRNKLDGDQSSTTSLALTKCFNIVVIDNTLAQNKLEQIEKDRELLRKKELMKDEFLAVASHELKTPIQPILGFALLAKKGLIDQEKAWSGVLQEARRLQQLANDILDVSRIESASLKYDIKKERINVLLSSIADTVRKELKEGVSLIVNYEKADEDLEVEIDRTRITQVIQNILGNAMKFTEMGEIRIESKVYRNMDKMEICISDTGKGLSNDIMPRLFEKFATSGHGNVENNKGTGLGLYISKAIVTGHGGEIKAFNNSDGGASFLISLPSSKIRIGGGSSG